MSVQDLSVNGDRHNLPGDHFTAVLQCFLCRHFQAATDCHILTISSYALLHATDESWTYHTVLIRNLLGIVARKNMYLNRKLKYTSHKTTAEKLLAYLNDQAKEKGTNAFYIPFNRQQLADYLGVERSAMSAEISRLASLGLLETRRSYFKLLKP